uniref:Uncharacterized protein n=1 Tax=Nicotiana tabacum TaxID=4097 RepID=A0A1S4BTQ7_TOBAC|nr:PREDICTED: uncharacterized protein LOC107811779 [Nicotiana tabacum]
MERIEFPPVTYDWAVQAFTHGLNERSLIASHQLKQNLIEYPAVSWADVHNRSASINQSDINRDPRSNKERYQPYTSDRRNSGVGRNHVQNDRRSDRGQNSRGLMSKNGFEKTEDCRQLREEVAHLFNAGQLRVFRCDRAKNHFRKRDANKKIEQKEPQHVINMIAEGVNIPQGAMLKRTKVSITGEKQTRDYVPEGTVSFSDKEAKGISQPHNDALVIPILLNKVQVTRVLVDPGSLVNIIPMRVLDKLGLQNQIVLAARVLNGFNMASETTK